MRVYDVHELHQVARGIAESCGGINAAGPEIVMPIPVYFDAGGPFAQLEPFTFTPREQWASAQKTFKGTLPYELPTAPR